MLDIYNFGIKLEPKCLFEYTYKVEKNLVKELKLHPRLITLLKKGIKKVATFARPIFKKIRIFQVLEKYLIKKLWNKRSTHRYCISPKTSLSHAYHSSSNYSGTVLE